MKRIGIALMALVLMGVGQAMAAPPVVSNVQVEIIDNQTPDLATPKGRVKITYDVADPDGDPLFVFVSGTKVQNNWNPANALPMVSVTGDVTPWDRTSTQMPTANITPGTGKEIIWDAPADWPNQESTNLQIQVRAYDGDMNQIRIDMGASVYMDFVWIPPGQFTDTGGTAVTIEEGFYLGKTEVTRAQYSRYQVPWGANGGSQPNLPMTMNQNTSNLSYVNRFINTHMANYKNGFYRTPTSDEWEHALRAGTTTKYYFGDDVNLIGGYEWFRDNSSNSPKDVAGKWPNPWGLYDMLGNQGELTDLIWGGSNNNAYTLRGGVYNWTTSNYETYPAYKVVRTNQSNSYPTDGANMTLRLVRTGP